MKIDFNELERVIMDIKSDIDEVKSSISKHGDDPAFMAVDQMIIGGKSGMRSYIQLQVLKDEL
jgi:hypothetical protein